ncbi:MAG TPA: DUF499 domain-containing protein [Actinomycetes bacterium]|nr:DUF499 domain-containing protein [Actinomycetes bacterium]
MGQPPHWADVLTLRQEVTDASGQVANLQMSLYSVVSQTADVPYRDVGYYGDITMPTSGLVNFMAQVAQRLGSAGSTRALFHLDQGMGGGKSHALVGLYHLANEPAVFLACELGRLVLAEAEQRANGPVDLTETRVVVLPADHMTPGVASAEFGPARTLHERFIWSLFPGDFDRYRRLVAQGPDKAALRAALEEAGGPVLILLDELMDYAQLLSDRAHRESMPGEQAFLNSLMDAVDDVPQVAFVVVMIKSELDDRGYRPEANEFRDYVARRLERNGVTASVTGAEDFAAIIRRRIFEQPTRPLPVAEVAAAWAAAADPAWTANVFERLPSTRGLLGLEQRLDATYPFHPDLMALVRDDWSRHAGFQRVRSTVDIFAATAFHSVGEHQAGRYAPALIGVGDLPLHRVIESVLSSGLLHGNDKAVQGFRAVAGGDVIAKDGAKGRAVELDAQFADHHPNVEPGSRPLVVLATALLLYSLVPRAQARKGATKPELLAALFHPGGLDFAGADEAFSMLVDVEEGLGSLQVIPGAGGNTPPRYQLTISQTLQMYYRQARSMVAGATGERDAYVWERVQAIAAKGRFEEAVFVEARPPDTPLEEVFREVDQAKTNRLVVLDPSRWSLGNGRETRTRDDITAMLGLGSGALRVDNAASAVVACIDAQRRELVRRRALEALAYQRVTKILDPDDELQQEARDRLRAAQGQVDDDLKRAFQHLAYLTRASTGIVVEWRRFDSETKTALSGNVVWDTLVNAGRAAEPGTLNGAYLTALLDVSERRFTLREVVRRFWQDPAFPLVSSEADIRGAIFDAVTLRNVWQILGSTGQALTIPSPDALAINSSEQIITKAEAPTSTDTSADGTTSAGDHEDADQRRPDEGTTTGGTGAGRAGDGPGGSAATSYTRYTVRLPSRSLTQPESRKKVFNLLAQATDDLDPTSGIDVQLAELTLNLTAADGSLGSLHEKAAAAEAQWLEEPDEF